MSPGRQRSKQSNSCVRVDGAFGLWSPAATYAAADSWATDGHKWLNVPYDSGIFFVRGPQALSSAMGLTASYLNPGAEFEPLQRCCRHARRFASVLARHNVAIFNEVSLNQVLAARRISVSSGATTDEDVERSLASLIRHLPAR